MRVMCIAPFDSAAPGCEHYPKPKVGNEYFVIRDGIINGKLYYALAGFDYDWAYAAENFATLPDQTDELHEEENISNLETV